MSHAGCGLSPERAYQKLMDGNKRYVIGKLQHPNQTLERRKEAAAGQAPFAAILTCSDSRVPAELIFDAGIGDVFSVENAGNYADSYGKASIQYAIAHLNVPVVMVLGHSKCGAVTATKSIVESHGAVEKGLEPIVESIKPAVEAVKGKAGDWVDNAIRQNVQMMVQDLRGLVAQLGKEGDCQVVGAYYDIERGTVEEVVGFNQEVVKKKAHTCCCGHH